MIQPAALSLLTPSAGRAAPPPTGDGATFVLPDGGGAASILLAGSGTGERHDDATPGNVLPLDPEAWPPLAPAAITLPSTPSLSAAPTTPAGGHPLPVISPMDVRPSPEPTTPFADTPVTDDAARDENAAPPPTEAPLPPTIVPAAPPVVDFDRAPVATTPPGAPKQGSTIATTLSRGKDAPASDRPAPASPDRSARALLATPADAPAPPPSLRMPAPPISNGKIGEDGPAIPSKPAPAIMPPLADPAPAVAALAAPAAVRDAAPPAVAAPAPRRTTAAWLASAQTAPLPAAATSRGVDVNRTMSRSPAPLASGGTPRAGDVNGTQAPVASVALPLGWQRAVTANSLRVAPAPSVPSTTPPTGSETLPTSAPALAPTELIAPRAPASPIESESAAIVDLPLPRTDPPPIPVAQPAPAGIVFGAARFAARTADDRDEPALPIGTAPLAAPVSIDRVQTVAASAPLDMAREHWPRAMIERIEMIRDAADAVDTRIRLVPDALGAIDVDVQRDGDTLHVRFHAEQPQTRALLADAAPRLTDAAEARGLRLGQTSVGGQGEGTAGQGQQPRQPLPAAPPRAPVSTTAGARDDADDTRLA